MAIEQAIEVQCVFRVSADMNGIDPCSAKCGHCLCYRGRCVGSSILSVDIAALAKNSNMKHPASTEQGKRWKLLKIHARLVIRIVQRLLGILSRNEANEACLSG